MKVLVVSAGVGDGSPMGVLTAAHTMRGVLDKMIETAREEWQQDLANTKVPLIDVPDDTKQYVIKVEKSE